jgi:hypothetical protein
MIQIDIGRMPTHYFHFPIRREIRTLIFFALLIVLTLLLSSCAAMRGAAIRISEEEWKNADACREIAETYLLIWPIQSGLIRGALGDDLSKLPSEAVAAMGELDELAKRPSKKMSDQDWGYSLGLRVRIMSTIVMEALRIYAPDVFTALVSVALR